MPGLGPERRDEFGSFLKALMRINPSERLSTMDLLAILGWMQFLTPRGEPGAESRAGLEVYPRGEPRRREIREGN